MKNENRKDIIVQNDKRYMRYIVNPYRGNRYEIYDREEGRPDVLLFYSHDRVAALKHWERIKDMPKISRRRDFIFW